MTKRPDSGQPGQTGFALAHGKAMYEYLSRHPDSLKRFADMMLCITREPGLGPEHLVNGYPWAELGEATMVDLGGSHGVMGCSLARKYPSLKLIVQDLYEPVNREAEARSPPDVAGRVQYMMHDFLKEQPQTVTGVDV
ncbi:hypothetical protein Daus18300_004615 [Diaporthe australafricana]|uniref:O-methyltransferase C-terminal domain-containing protein n=1 Tax=Diaporthe australafricana TaxID=127596 RepID=A0ABR3X6Q6_9PEZI